MGATTDPFLLLFFAVPEEARPFIRRWELVTQGRARRVSGPGLASWELDSRPLRIRVQVTGMGPRNAARVGAEALEAGLPAAAVLTAGFAGGLESSLRCGDVLMDADEGFPLRESLVRGGVRGGRFHESVRVAVTAAEKAGLRAETGADAVEMESATLRALARQRGIPGATVRVISDAASEALPLDFNALMTPEDRLDFLRLAWTVARSPGRIPHLMRFQKTVRHAAESLAGVLVSAVQSN
ncbi:MAG: hypothetical protein RIS76_3952 [Verrucomicrobiota bacterium]